MVMKWQLTGRTKATQERNVFSIFTKSHGTKKKSALNGRFVSLLFAPVAPSLGSWLHPNQLAPAVAEVAQSLHCKQYKSDQNRAPHRRYSAKCSASGRFVGEFLPLNCHCRSELGILTFFSIGVALFAVLEFTSTSKQNISDSQNPVGCYTNAKAWVQARSGKNSNFHWFTYRKRACSLTQS